MKTETRIFAISNHDGILLVNSCRGLNANKWDLPSGEIRPTEKPAEALRRIVLSETGYHVHGVSLHDVWTHRFSGAEDFFQIGIIYWVSLIGGVPEKLRSEDVCEAKWFQLDNMETIVRAPFAILAASKALTTGRR